MEEVCTLQRSFYFRMVYTVAEVLVHRQTIRMSPIPSLLPVRDILQLFVHCTCAKNEFTVAFMSKLHTLVGLQ
jgi:hypothetical protein